MPGLLTRAFDPRGRLSASAYRRFCVQALLASAGLVCLAIWLASLGLRIPAILAFAGNLPVLLVALARTAQRLHDRDRSAGWLVAYAVVYAASLAPIEDAADDHPLAVAAGVLMMLGFFVWFFVETVMRRGTPGPNRFGADPTIRYA